MMDPSRSPAAVSDEGRHARERGDPPGANPYPAGSDEHRTWRRGYDMPGAQADDRSAEGGRADPA